MTDIETAFARVRDIALARGLTGIEEGTSYGTPALRVRRKLLVHRPKSVRTFRINLMHRQRIEGILEPLDVERQEVIPGDGEPADWRLSAETSMRPVAVVAVQPSWQFASSLF